MNATGARAHVRWMHLYVQEHDNAGEQLVSMHRRLSADKHKDVLDANTPLDATRSYAFQDQQRRL